MNRKSREVAAMLAVAGVLVGACGSGRSGTVADKAGGETVVLHLATIDGEVRRSGPGIEAFVAGLADVSDGRLQVDVAIAYGDRTADAESRLVEAIASGELDGGWPATRAFASAGIEGLEAVEAPMTITSYDAAREVVAGPIAGELLGSLDGTGVVGLGLVVGTLRRPFAAEAPLLGPEDWAGERFRSFNSPVQAATVRALGAEPVNLGINWIDELGAGTLRGTEFDVPGYADNGLTTEAGYVTANVVLWPKVYVLSLSQQRWDSLSDEQRGWVEQAAADAVEASVGASYDETSIAQKLCDQGVRFVNASDGQVDAMREAVAVVIDSLAAEPASRAVLTQIQALAEKHPDPDVPDVPTDCQQGSVVATGGFEVVPDETSSLPEGVYRAQITQDDVDAGGITNDAGWTGFWTLEVSNGTYVLSCQILDNQRKDCGNSLLDDAEPYVFEAGYLRGTGATVYWLWDHDVLSEVGDCPCDRQPTLRFTWALEGDQLTLSDPADEEGGGGYTGFVLEPWQKIA